MTTATFEEITAKNITITIDENYDDSSWDTGSLEDMLEYGFDAEKPLVIDESGYLLDGNHRWVALCKEGRQEDAIFVVVSDFYAIECKAEEAFKAGELSSDYEDFSTAWNYDNNFFYKAIAKFA